MGGLCITRALSQRYVQITIIVIIVRGMSRPAAAFSFQRLAECLRSLPCLFVTDVGVADCRADILVAE
jgi:hypothetical protein